MLRYALACYAYATLSVDTMDPLRYALTRAAYTVLNPAMPCPCCTEPSWLQETDAATAATGVHA